MIKNFYGNDLEAQFLTICVIYSYVNTSLVYEFCDVI